MKYMPLVFVLGLMFLTGCQEKSSKTTTVSCIGNNYFLPGCPGYNQYSTGGQTSGTTSGTTTGGTTGSTNNTCYQGNNYYYLQGCPGFCQYYPTHASCSSGGTTGSTTGGTTGGSTTNPYPQTPSSVLYTNWGVKYPGGVPSGSCSQSYSPTGVTFTPYATRSATITMAGHDNYDPTNVETQNAYNTSSILKTVNQAKTLYSTDAILKVRFKPKPQPDSALSPTACYGRLTGQSSTPGYTKLMFTVNVVGWDANNNRSIEPVGVYTVGVNSCSQGIDLSSFASRFPNGMYVQISDIYANQNCWWDNNTGFNSCNAFKLVREADCWSMDIEVAADGTKTFD